MEMVSDCSGLGHCFFPVDSRAENMDPICEAQGQAGFWALRVSTHKPSGRVRKRLLLGSLRTG